ncbi:hypothetical protein HS7_20600 [Sulfolobales archaeon HS-7]|nr:hypothetical protein HS7_20600 [Sulfolobales archaeon HS-7]
MSIPNQPKNSPIKRKRIDTRVLFILVSVIAAIGYIIYIHHSDTKPTSTPNTINTETNANTTKISTNYQLQFIAYNFSLSNSMQKGITTEENGTVYLQISGYFNQFPGNYPQYLTGKIYIIYMQITVYNSTQTKSVLLPVFTTISYSNQKYFVYEAQGSTAELKQLLSLLKPNEFVGIVFYTNSTQIQGYTVW